MARITILGGDFLKGRSAYGFGTLVLRTEAHPISGETIPLSELESIEVASEESVKKIGGTIGWGAAGALVLGPVGLLAGLLLGGKKKEVTFVAKLKDGRKFLATADSGIFTKLKAAVF